MGFFDDLGKKISETSQNTIQKGKDMADVAKLNSLISDEQKRITNNYIEIGKLYLSLHEADCEEGFAKFISEIKQSNAEIDKLQKQIEDIKGIKRCPVCGASVPSESAFCNSCGNKMPEEAPKAPAGPVCANCGAELAEGVAFCNQCGTKVEAPAPEAPAAEASAENKCPNCNNVVPEGAAFCTGCGTKLN